MMTVPIQFGASVSEPHIDEFAVNLSYVRHAVNHFLLLFAYSYVMC